MDCDYTNTGDIIVDSLKRGEALTLVPAMDVGQQFKLSFFFLVPRLELPKLTIGEILRSGLFLPSIEVATF